jgi:hypothetical protein
MATSPRILAPLLAALACSGCLSGGYYRAQAFEPVAHAKLAALEPGKATLDEALRSLGAPLFVWEWKGDGAALAWGWRDLARWGFSVSVPLTHNDSASFSYDRLARDLPGAVLFFDQHETLVEAREGKLADIQAETIRTRPAPPPENPQ